MRILSWSAASPSTLEAKLMSAAQLGQLYDGIVAGADAMSELAIRQRI
jgi:hypothetical protein